MANVTLNDLTMWNAGDVPLLYTDQSPNAGNMYQYGAVSADVFDLVNSCLARPPAGERNCVRPGGDG